MPEHQSDAAAKSEEAAQAPKAPRRGGGRPSRGRRGRGGRPANRPYQTVSHSGASSEPAPAETGQETQPMPAQAEPVRQELAERPASPAPFPAKAVQEAIDDVNHVIELLRESLEEMDEVLETLELAERQKQADEREIESLRQALRNLHRGRDPQRRQD